MLNGGTPTHEFELPIETSMISDVLITYAQSGIIILEKCMKDCVANGNTLSLKLKQEETLLFDRLTTIEIQLKIKTLGEEVIPSEIIYDTPQRCLSKVIL